MQHDALGSIQQHLVDVEDVDEANLLSQLPDAVAFVAAALGWHTAVAAVAAACVSATSAGTAAPGTSGSDDSSSNSATGRGGSNRVLIHCAQGVSRSAAVAAACLLARAALQPATPTAPLEPAAAVAELQRHWPRAAPNPGFMAQLELFAAMGCSRLESYVPYKRFLLQQASWRPVTMPPHAGGRATGFLVNPGAAIAHFAQHGNTTAVAASPAPQWLERHTLNPR